MRKLLNWSGIIALLVVLSLSGCAGGAKSTVRPNLDQAIKEAANHFPAPIHQNYDGHAQT